MSRAVQPIASLARRVPEAGRIRTGVKSGAKNSPKAIGEFRFTSHDRTAIDQIAAMYGGTVQGWSDPKAAAGQFEVVTDASEIRIVLPPDPLGGSPVYEMWGGGGCERRCDGVTCTTTQHGPEGPEPVDVPCMCSANGALACKVTTRLSVILPEIRFAGVWRLDTKSWNAAQELPGMVDMIHQAQGRGLQYATLGLKHRRSVNGGQTRTFLVPTLGLDATVEELAAGATRLTTLAAPIAPQLEAGDNLATADQMARIKDAIGALDDSAVAEVKAWWIAAGFPSVASGDLTADQAAAVLAHLVDATVVDAEIVDDPERPFTEEADA